MTHRLRPEKLKRGRHRVTIRRRPQQLNAILIGTTAGALSTTAAVLIARRRRRSPSPNLLASFPGHKALRDQLVTVTRSLQRRERERSQWRAAGEPVEASDALQLANESVLADVLHLADLAARLEPLLAEERERGEAIGPTTSAALTRLHDLLETATRAIR